VLALEDQAGKPRARRIPVFSSSEWTRLAGMYGVIGLLHVTGVGLFLGFASGNAGYAGAGLLAYTLGMRHAFDADHISAVDDTTRFLLQKGKQPLAAGFFFSLGHSSVVLLLSLGIAVAATAVQSRIPAFERYGGIVGATVSGTFLWIIGLLNLVVLLGIIRVWREVKQGRFDHQRLEELLVQRGFLNRLLGGRAQRFINHSWQLYPLGLLFGLGFDTASQVGLLALAGGATTGHAASWAIISLPILFAAGMSLIDTTDGVLMLRAYGWAFSSPLRKLWYNLTTTGLSVAVALLVGSIELLQVLSANLGWHGAFFDFLNERLDLGLIGYVIVGLFMFAWIFSVTAWKIGRFEARYGASGA
jgi:high-affinity nickel-transport protein